MNDPLHFHRRLVDSIVESITFCLQTNEKDENIQLLVINILLTMLTNPRIEIHDRSLLSSYRAFLHIYSCKIMTKKLIN